jgi:hypothetical protein
MLRLTVHAEIQKRQIAQGANSRLPFRDELLSFIQREARSSDQFDLGRLFGRNRVAVAERPICAPGLGKNVINIQLVESPGEGVFGSDHGSESPLKLRKQGFRLGGIEAARVKRRR